MQMKYHGWVCQIIIIVNFYPRKPPSGRGWGGGEGGGSIYINIYPKTICLLLLV